MRRRWTEAPVLVGERCAPFGSECRSAMKSPSAILRSASFAHRSAAARFDLVRWFSALCLLSITLIGALSSIVLSRFLSERLLEHDAALLTALLNNIVRVEQAEAFFDSNGAQRLEGDVAELFVHLGRMPEVLRANVYFRDGTVAWSSRPELIGKRFAHNEELGSAFAGKPENAMGTVGAAEKEEHAFFTEIGMRFVETYVPIFDGAGTRTIGAIEIYRSPRELFATLDAGTRLIWLGSIAAGAFLFLVLFSVVRRGSRIIADQQRQLADSQTLAALGEMASAVAHGLRNPLASMRSSAELAFEFGPGREVSELLDDIIVQSDRLEHWVRQYLSHAQPESGAAVIERSLESFATELQRHDIEHTAEIARDLAPATLNPLVMAQVLNSLFANAIEAMAGGGHLRVRAQASADQASIEITIADTGSGMNAEQIELALQPFVTSKGTGLGLGLPLARSILERHGGWLHLANGPDGGLVVSLGTPAAR